LQLPDNGRPNRIVYEKSVGRWLWEEKNVALLQLVCLEWLSLERDKYISEDFYERPWEEIIGRVHLLKAHDTVENKQYVVALADFEQALTLLAKKGVRQDYSVCALADKAVVQCFLAQYEAALVTMDQALAVAEPSDRDMMLRNRSAILVLTGAYSEALNALDAQLRMHPHDSDLRFTQATCLLHLERYHEAVVAYEQVIAEDRFLRDDAGLIAARQGKQPDWAHLSVLDE
jgi:tetratricopeptide (TPR) repeat protein